MGNKLHLYADVTDRFSHLSGANDTLEGLETVIGVKLLLLHKIWMLICDLNAVFLFSIHMYGAKLVFFVYLHMENISLDVILSSFSAFVNNLGLSGLLRTTRSNFSLMAHFICSKPV